MKQINRYYEFLSQDRIEFVISASYRYVLGHCQYSYMYSFYNLAGAWSDLTSRKDTEMTLRLNIKVILLFKVLFHALHD